MRAWRLTRVSIAASAIASQAVPVLDPAAYAEPEEAEYWGGGSSAQPPFQEPRLRSADLTREDFDRRILDGQVFVVEDVGRDWPMANWDCEYFRSDPTFRGAEMNRQYAADGGAPFVGLGSGWVEAETSSGATDGDAPQLAPYYWGIKDVQYPDAHRSKTWKRSMLKKVQEHVRLPAFMDSANRGSFERTPEFWFAGRGAGAKAHMDTHVQATISLQLAGTKRWRLRVMEARRAPFLAMMYTDGQVYEGSQPWVAHFNVTLRQGEALFFPPGFIHETLNLDKSEGSCSASVTFQFASPFATRMYRRFLPRVRRTADIHEAWPLLARWATLDGRVPRAGLPYADARDQALGSKGAGATFTRLDKDRDGSLSGDELVSAFGPGDARDLLGFHDLDEDGAVGREEFAEVFGFWAGTVKAVMSDTPKRFRDLQLKDMEGDFNIEDLGAGKRKQLLAVARAMEAQRLVGGGASGGVGDGGGREL